MIEDPLSPLSDNSGRLRDRMLVIWERAKAEYRAAGEPFGPSARAIELWMTYKDRTTAN